MIRLILSIAIVLSLVIAVHSPIGVMADSHDEAGEEASGDDEPEEPGGPSPTEPQPDEITSSISVDAGGTLELRNVSVLVPAGVVTDTATVTARLEFFEYDNTKQAPPEGMIVGTAFELTLQSLEGDPITNLAAPLEIVVSYTAQELADAGGDSQNIIMGILDPVTGEWEQIPSTPDPVAGTVSTSRDHLTKFTVLSVVPSPELSGPSDGAVASAFSTLLEWGLGEAMTQYHIQVIPFANDGPGIDLIRNAESSYQVQPPEVGVGNYILLPGMTYTWRIRTSAARRSLGADEPYWSAWSETRTFRTPAPVTWGLQPVNPAPGGTIESATSTLQWTDQFTYYFYYEIQVSGDPTFNTDPATATSFVWHNLVHGGVTSPLNSWTTPELPQGSTIYWRVRPRVQGDGTPVEWSDAWSFHTP